MRTPRALLAAALWAACAAPTTAATATDAPADADTRALLERIEELEQRIRDLETDRAERDARALPAAPPAGAGLADWTRRVRLGGSADAGYFGGEENAFVDPDSFQVWDARLFVDAQLGERIALGERTVLRNVGFLFEWDLVRLGSLDNRVGELYVDFQGVLGQDALNFQVGRFQIPVGEAYLRYSRGYADKPFISNPVGGPWWWDEGVRAYGSSDEGLFGYVASLSDGDTPFNAESSYGRQGTLRLFARPAPWLYASVSGLYSGRTGSSSSPASGALWLGEAWALAFGAFSGVDNYQDGAVIADGPNVLASNWLVAGDVILDFPDALRAWLAYGRYEIDSTGGSTYDRALHYWIAEVVLRGAWLSETLRPFYLGARGSGLGTYRSDEGYALDRRLRPTLGYNVQSITDWSAVLGWEITRYLTLRAEYTLRDVDLVRLPDPLLRAAARDTDYFGIEVGASF